MTLRLHDTRRGAMAAFSPPADGPIGLYVCGITPYDSGHLGHAATYVAFDVLNRYLRYLGHSVRYVQNLTDVDDDMLRRARELGEDYLELGNRHVESFFRDMDALNWLRPDVYPRATEHIEPMLRLIARLLESGHAYEGAGHVYYDVARFHAYGALSRIPRSEMLPIANERGNVPEMPGKRHPLDFVLWQPSGADEPSWPSPWGPGRPGWHIECSAMSIEYLGPRFEIHGGGADLIFPHHESEIAQSEAATGESPFVEFWLHTAMVHHDGEKMSKSLGNLVLVRDLLDEHRGAAVRHYLLSSHYRAELTHDPERLDASAHAVEQLLAACRGDASAAPAEPSSRNAGVLEDARRRFLGAMDDDLDTPRALRALDELARVALDSGADGATRDGARALLGELGGSILGLDLAGDRDARADLTLVAPSRR